MSDTATKALSVAIMQIGQEEQPRGSNWGHPVKDYLASVGINFPASWCMAFVYWCFNQNRPNPLVQTGGVLHAWQENDAHHKITSGYQSGDVFIMDLGHGLGHTGFIEKVEGTTLHTVEGNTNDLGSREGYEVCRKTRSISSIIGALRY